MVQLFKELFGDNLSSLKWMDSASIQNARIKLQHMEAIIGYPAFTLENKWLDKGTCHYSLYLCMYSMSSKVILSLIFIRIQISQHQGRFLLSKPNKHRQVYTKEKYRQLFQ